MERNEMFPTFLLGQCKKLPEALSVPKNRPASHYMKICCFNQRRVLFLRSKPHHKALRDLPAVRLTTEAVPAVIASTWEWISCLDSSTLFWTHTRDACKSRQVYDTVTIGMGLLRTPERSHYKTIPRFCLYSGLAPKRPRSQPCPSQASCSFTDAGWHGSSPGFFHCFLFSF